MPPSSSSPKVPYNYFVLKPSLLPNGIKYSSLVKKKKNKLAAHLSKPEQNKLHCDFSLLLWFSPSSWMSQVPESEEFVIMWCFVYVCLRVCGFTSDTGN